MRVRLRERCTGSKNPGPLRNIRKNLGLSQTWIGIQVYRRSPRGRGPSWPQGNVLFPQLHAWPAVRPSIRPSLQNATPGQPAQRIDCPQSAGTFLGEAQIAFPGAWPFQSVMIIAAVWQAGLMHNTGVSALPSGRLPRSRDYTHHIWLWQMPSLPANQCTVVGIL